MTVFAVFDDLKATDTWTLVYHWEDQDNLAGVRPALLTPRLIDESSSANAADTQEIMSHSPRTCTSGLCIYV